MKKITILLNGNYGSQLKRTGLDKGEFDTLVKLGFEYKKSDAKTYETSYVQEVENDDHQVSFIHHKKKMLSGNFENWKEILTICENLTGRNRVDICLI